METEKHYSEHDTEFFEFSSKKIGENIRAIRKRKGMTLRELAEGLFSLGKLSNIENGTLKRIYKKDIELIAKRLDVPIIEIIDEELYAKFKTYIKKIKNLISLGDLRIAKKRLVAFRKQIEKHNLEEFLADYYFAIGHLNMKRKNYNFAITYFTYLINISEASDHEVDLKIRAYNALSYIHYDKGGISKAIGCANEALYFVHNNPNASIYNKLNVNFNLCIYLTSVAHLDAAIQYGNNSLKYTEGGLKYVTQLMLALIQISNGEPEEAYTNLEECHNYFEREDVIKNLMLTIQCKYYLFKVYPNKYDKELEAMEDSLPHEALREDCPEHLFPMYLNLCHTFIHFALKEKRYSDVEEQLKICLDSVERFPKERLNFKTYHLYATFVRENKGNKMLEKFFLEKALTFLENESSIPKALILHELGELEETSPSSYKKASDIFYGAYQHTFSMLAPLRSMLPEPRY
ncbi:transcriptional regulator with XRE-family HTH domain [Evansella vedderi]|uniref:Transcriptional regulator with XRE-family HTH domain n=1 Tax=Evansella vedderi TaxID=38282 RepID=A0ABT9ZWL4_9BACI|nr:helix-turn-helix transcriptional regulator [Evansella vedderi]MDQ0255617.1 transcriptional regulator with XRE-family HTH domain [Evansella vedderi]